MPNLNSLVSQPGSHDPPDVQGADGTQQQTSLQSLMGQGGGQGALGGFQAPNHHETVALLQHLSAFRRGWQNILNDPEIGESNVRPKIYDFMADMMNDGYVTLPQVMNQLKTVPDTPLEQRQWLEENIQRDDKAMAAVLQHHAAASRPPASWEDGIASAGPEPKTDPHELVAGAVARYKQHGKRNKQNKSPRGIPLA